MDTTLTGRLRLEVRRDKKGHPQHKEDPQKYKSNSAGANQYRNDSHRDYLHLPVESTLRLFESRPPVKLTPGTLASSGGAKVLFIGGLQMPNQPQSCPSRAAHQAGLAKLMRQRSAWSARAYAGEPHG